ncbi:MAG TPA: BON domain-containing protein [Pirellulales bacterium]|nr:BON domain-containing protein [Pirellulales bacterium]
MSVSDVTISRNVTRQLAGRGLRSPCHIQVQTRNGEVTLSGTVQFVHQRDAAVQAIRTVEGVKRIVEKLKVKGPAKPQYPQPTARPAKQPAVEEAVAKPEETTPESQPQASNEQGPLSDPSPAPDPRAVAAGESADLSFAFDGALQAAGRSASNELLGMRQTRKGESYTFECASQEEAERLRAVLATYADWLKKNSWVGQSKVGGEVHRVTFHAKSVIDFLRQVGF